MKPYRCFNIVSASITLTSLALVGLFNAAVDPYGVINTPSISSFNEVKPAKGRNVRLFKARDIAEVKPKTIFLGTSKTEYGLDPEHPALKEDPVYNLGLPNANMYEQMRYLQHALANTKDLKMVIVGLDFFSFNSANYNSIDFEESRLEKSYLVPDDLLKVSFSFDALRASASTILLNLRGDLFSLYLENGKRDRNENASSKSTEALFNEYLSAYINRPELYGNYSLSDEMLSNLKDIVDICDRQNITLKIFISPSHATQWEAIQAVGLWASFEQWKREIAKISSFWDFSGYNSVTTEPIDKSIQNYYDSAHYSQEVGNMILNRILKYQEESVPDDFGVYVTRENLNEHLQKTVFSRELYAKSNPNLVQLIKSLKK